MTAPMPDFNVIRPRSVPDAITARRSQPDSQFIAGGTDLMVNVRHGIKRPSTLIDISQLDDIIGIDVSDAGVQIGAGVTLAALARHPDIAARYRAVVEAAAQVAGPGHRGLATVGGNLCLDTRCIYYNQSEWWRRANRYCLKHRGDTCHVAPQGQHCHAAFTGDLAPAFIALSAEVVIADASGQRRIPLEDLYEEDGRAHLKLADDELLVSVHLPPATTLSSYAKARMRGAIDYPLAGVAAALAVTGGRIASLRIAITGTNSRPFVVAGTETMIARPIDDAALKDIDRMVQKQVQPMRTTIATAHYRRLTASALARRLSADLFKEACR